MIILGQNDRRGRDAAQSLARSRGSRNLGRSEAALWGECQGSALYQVRVDRRDEVTDTTADERMRLRLQRTWLMGTRSHRCALVLQFAAGNANFAERLVPATRLPAVLAFWPSAMPQRALLHDRRGPQAAWQGRMPGAATIQAFLGSVAQALARLPWMHRLPCVLLDVVAVRARDGGWSLVDRDGALLPMSGSDRESQWTLLACSGGHPVDVACEWNGRALRPLLAITTSDTVILEHTGDEA